MLCHESRAAAIGAFSGAIFDMDGTLTDTMPVWETTGERFMAAHGLAMPPGMMDDLKSMGMIQTAGYLRARFSLAESPQAIIDEMNKLVEKGYYETAPAKRDILPFLEKLREKGVAMCVATATDRHLAEAILRRTGLAGYFRFIITCTEAGAGKDTPLIYEQAIKRLGTPKTDTLVFEDAPHAVRTAKGAGFRVVAVQDDSCREDERAIRETADLFIRRYAELVF